MKTEAEIRAKLAETETHLNDPKRATNAQATILVARLELLQWILDEDDDR